MVMNPVSIADALFTKTRQRVLGLLYGNPHRSFYTNEIVRSAGMGRGTVGRELDRLANAGLLRITATGNQRHYQANADNPVYAELVGLVRKTFGIADRLREALQSLDSRIDCAFVYGSVARGEDNAESDIDVMVVANDLPYAELMEALAGAEAALGRPVNPTLYTQVEFDERRASKNAFIKRVMEQPKLWIKGVKDDTASITESGQDPPVKT
jgi:predicted nucleotidyltransferase